MSLLFLSLCPFFCGNKCIDNSNNQIIQSRWLWILFIVIIAIDALTGFDSNWGTFFLDCGNHFFECHIFSPSFSESLLPFTCVYGTMIKYIHVSISWIEITYVCICVCVCVFVCVGESVKDKSAFRLTWEWLVFKPILFCILD